VNVAATVVHNAQSLGYTILAHHSTSNGHDG